MLELHGGDCRSVLAQLPEGSLQTCITSPPYYGLRDYGLEPISWADGWVGTLGLEPTPDLYVEHLMECLDSVWRVLHPTGTLWLNLGDSYARDARKGQHKPEDPGKQAAVYRSGGGRASATVDLAAAGAREKSLLLMPYRVALAMQARGWIIRSDIIWHKPNPCPESVRDRPTRSHEYLFLATKNPRYYADMAAVRERGVIAAGTKGAKGSEARASAFRVNSRPTEYKVYDGYRNKRDVWTIKPAIYPGAHFAVFPEALVRPCIQVGTSLKGQCAACGTPWRRVEAPTPEYAELLGKGWEDDAADAAEGRGHFTLPDGSRASQRPTKRNAPSVGSSYVTTGWEPDCKCQDAGDPVPQTVLDPFAGTGTVGQVALALGRRAVLIEAQEKYHPLIYQRLAVGTVKRKGKRVVMAQPALDLELAA